MTLSHDSSLSLDIAANLRKLFTARELSRTLLRGVSYYYTVRLMSSDLVPPHVLEAGLQTYDLLLTRLNLTHEQLCGLTPVQDEDLLTGLLAGPDENIPGLVERWRAWRTLLATARRVS